MIPILIFGTGQLALNMLNRFEPKTYRVLAFADNNKEKQHTCFQGLEVISPDDIKKYDYEAVIICSSYYNEIYEQLLHKCNVAKEKIFSCHALPMKYNLEKMKLSNWKSIDGVFRVLEEFKPEKVLDAGLVLIKYGLLAREFYGRSVTKSLDGWNLDNLKVLPVHMAVYEHIYQQEPKTGYKYDLILAVELLHSRSYFEGKELLFKLKAYGKRLLVNLPILRPGEMKLWKNSDFEELGSCRFFHEGEFGYVMITVNQTS